MFFKILIITPTTKITYTITGLTWFQFSECIHELNYVMCFQGMSSHRFCNKKLLRHSSRRICWRWFIKVPWEAKDNLSHRSWKMETYQELDAMLENSTMISKLVLRRIFMSLPGRDVRWSGGRFLMWSMVVWKIGWIFVNSIGSSLKSSSIATRVSIRQESDTYWVLSLHPIFALLSLAVTVTHYLWILLLALKWLLLMLFGTCFQATGATTSTASSTSGHLRVIKFMVGPTGLSQLLPVHSSDSTSDDRLTNQ